MKKALLSLTLTLCLLLTACASSSEVQRQPNGQTPATSEAQHGENNQTDEASTAGVLFTYQGKEYDLQEREPSVNSFMGETPVGDFLVVEGHIGPNVSYYGIFDTKSETFVRDILGAHLTWQDGDITTAVYDVWTESKVYNYDGQPIVDLDMEESEYIYSLSWADSQHLNVEIMSVTSEIPRVLELDISQTSNTL